MVMAQTQVWPKWEEIRRFNRTALLQEIGCIAEHLYGGA